MRFRATIQLTGKTTTGIEVPEDLVAALGPSKRPAVRVALDEYTSRCRIAHTGVQKSLKEILEAASDRGRGVRSRGERPPTRGAPNQRR